MADAPKISIVIPTRNRRTLLTETIDSILAQTFADWELIVVDDASEDDTFACVSRLDDRRIRVIRLEQHAERSVARNTGLEMAKGEFILFFDDDDLLVESGLQTHVDAFVHHPAAIASVGNVVNFDERGAQQAPRFVRHRQERNLWVDVLSGWTPACGRSLFRTSAMKSVQGWKTAFIPSEDSELWLRLSRLGPVVLSPETVYRYRVHGGQWRPPKRQTLKLLTAMRDHAVQQLDGNEKQRAEQILAARDQTRLAARQYREAETFRALISFLKVVRLFPAILRSPIMGPKLRRRILRCLIGGESLVRWWWPSIDGTIHYSVRSIRRSSKRRNHLGEAAPATRQSDDDD